MLFTPEEAQAVSARVKTAFRVLGDANERARYDRALDEQTANGSIAVPDGVAPTLNETTTLAEDVPALVTVAEGDWPASGTDQQHVEGILATAARCDGPTIQRLREARDMTLGEINLTTRISLSNLRFIKADTLDALPAPVYLRGYLRQIAQQLDGDADWVLSSHMTRITTASTPIR